MSKSTKTSAEPHMIEKIIIGVLVTVVIGVGAWAFQNNKTKDQRIQVQHQQIRTKDGELSKLNGDLNKVNKQLKDTKASDEASKKKIEELEKQKQELEGQLHARAEQKRKLAAAATVSTPAAAKPTPRATNISGNKHTWLAASGIPQSQWHYVDAIVTRESGWNPNAVNKSSGACGLGQQLPCGKWAGAWNDPVAALKAMNGYVHGRYGGWAQANAFWNKNHWY